MTRTRTTERITIATGIRHCTGWTRLREHAKLWVRARWHGAATAGWLRCLNADPFLADLAEACPPLLHKIYRPYVTATLTSVQRTAALIDHYDVVRRHGWAPLVREAVRAPVLLARFAGRSGTVYELRLGAVHAMRREGELVFQLVQGGTPLCCCAFSLFRATRAQLGIGGLQGTNAPGGADLIRTATRDLHGLRPKHLLVKLLGALGHAAGCRSLLLVGNRNHAVRRARRAGKVHADYDAFWRACGATARPDGDFELPCRPVPPPDLAGIPSSKRAAARQRYRLLAALQDDVLAALSLGQAAPARAA